MGKRLDWSTFSNLLRRYEGGDLEWINPEGSMYRGPIKGVTRSESGERVHLALGWCSFQPLHAGSSWRYIKDYRSFEIFKTHVSNMESVSGTNGQVTFESSGFLCTLYPKGQNLLPEKVQEMPAVHKLRVIK